MYGAKQITADVLDMQQCQIYRLHVIDDVD